MIRLAPALFALVAGLWASAASAQDALADARLGAARPRIARAVEAARAEGLPEQWLLDKVVEGLSKRVSPPRIAVAVDQLLERIRAARELVRPVGEDMGLLRSALDALSAGVTPASVRALIRDVGGADPARARRALTTVAELAERGFDPSVAVAATTDAHRRGQTAGMRELLRSARRISAHGDRDGALRRAGRGVSRGSVDRGRSGRDHGPRGPRRGR